SFWVYAFPCGTGFIREEACVHTANFVAGIYASRINSLLQLRYGPHRFKAALACFGFCFVFDLDLKRPVKPRWPKFDIDWEGKPAGRRFSRTGPGMALCGGPPNQGRITGMPSQSEGPSGGARAFCLLLGCSKVRRRKGATKSRRYHDN